MAKQVKVTPSTDEMIEKLSKQRKEKGAFNRSKQDIVAEAVESLFKKEVK